MHTYYVKTKDRKWEIAKLVQIVDNILINSWKDNCIIRRYILLETSKGISYFNTSWTILATA